MEKENTAITREIKHLFQLCSKKIFKLNNTIKDLLFMKKSYFWLL